MDIQQLIQDFSNKLKGHNAFIQIHIDGHYITKRIGDINRLVDNPTACPCIKESSFLEWMEEEIDKEHLAQGTILNHRATLAILKKFRFNLCFSDLDYKCICAFEYFLKSAGYAINTIAKFMKILRKYINLAIDEELISNYPFRKYVIKTERRPKTSLTEREVNKIEHELSTENLAKEERTILNGFLMSVYSGLRYSDIIRLTKQHIRKIYRNTWLTMRMQKTEQEVRIPISKVFKGKAMTIISNNKTTTGRLFKLPSNARCNLLLNCVLKRIGIHRHVSFHCARHTCATLLLNKGVSLPVIQYILGHRSIKTTQIYSAVKDSTISKEIARAFR